MEILSREACNPREVQIQPEQELIWRSPEEIVEIGFQRCPVVMMNEAHSGFQRCIRTRQIGRRILPAAHQVGVRHLAMEALFPKFADQSNHTRHLMEMDSGYLSQPEMRDFMQTALDLGWTLVHYEANRFKWLTEKHGVDFSNAVEQERIRLFQEFQPEFTTLEYANWREDQQALTIIEVLQALPLNTPMLVWCGNSHHSKRGDREWIPMGNQFKKHSNIDPFVIDQLVTVKFDRINTPLYEEFVESNHELLVQMGGTAGLLREEVTNISIDDSEDAFLFSTENELE